MGSTSKKIHNLNSLNKEILKLEAKANSIEQKLDSNFNYLQGNYRSMIKNSVFKKSATGEGFGSAILQTIITNDGLQNAISKIVNRLTGKLVGWLEALAERATR